ncbi:hypothetical protein CIK73_13580 [Brachybacterium alimentarium]|uniref:hypothetical protein n=1 Tax=Brachybacterium alimentarium TaxID=47845 RepID=UPI000DF18217|nr:hypothetical protein [Brachybacterium alimentarium]RCS65308.1 hypothetical protein CIK73_13580 [Brachybacterium alimentarium]RCS87892.1 hypothetical protein CIK69_13925 [Brachybacterium alimentarium]
MSTSGPGGVELVVAGDPAAARALVEEFFVGRGWRPRERGVGRVDFECGSRRRTILLGGLAGKAFHLTARIEIRDAGRDGVPRSADRTAVIRYRWGADDGRTLGGTLGRARAARAHAETATALEEQLRARGHLVRARRA